MCGDLGTCGECELFGNAPDLLGDVKKMNLLGCIAMDMEDENDPVATAWCPNAGCDHPEWPLKTHLVAEDTPACSRKVEPSDADLATELPESALPEATGGRGL